MYTKFKNNKARNDAVDLGLQQQLSQCIEKSIQQQHWKSMNPSLSNLESSNKQAMKQLKIEAIEKRKSKVRDRLKHEVESLVFETEKTCIAFEKQFSQRMGKSPASKSPTQSKSPSEH